MRKIGYHIQYLLLTCSVFVAYFPSAKAQQENRLTQYMNNELLINPAFAGMEKAAAFSFVHRSQWSDTSTPSNMQVLTGHLCAFSQMTGTGLSVIRKSQSDIDDIEARLYGSYMLSIMKNHSLSFGLSSGVRNRNYVLNDDTEQPDKIIMGADSKTGVIGGFGVLYKSPYITFSLSMPDIIHESSDDKTNAYFQQLFSYAKIEYLIDYNWTFEPSFLVRYVQDNPVSVDGTVAFSCNKGLYFGLGYRSHYGFNGILKAKVTGQLSVAYSYDFGEVNKDNKIYRTSHEVTVNVLLKRKNYNSKSTR